MNKTILNDCIAWALNKPDIIVKKKGCTIKQQQKLAQDAEKVWGNTIIGQTNNVQWTTKLGENLVYEVLALRGETPRSIKPIKGFQPDWETDNYIYEVKTRNWNTSGTAGEKVLGTWIKYQSVPEIFGKPLRIVCVAYQEYEYTHGKINYFGEHITEKTKSVLDLAKSWGIEYVKFSELVKDVQL